MEKEEKVAALAPAPEAEPKKAEKAEKPKKDKTKKKGKGKKVLLAIIVILLLAGIGVGVWAGVTGKLDFIFNPNDTSKTELKRTEPVTAKSEGVYITDVSDVVDAVMPSIVAITSKTVINSGFYGPMLYGYGYGGSYVTEGAGSGVIISESGDNIFVLTNYHVVEDASELSVQFIDDKSCDATIKGVSKRRDIAIVSVSKEAIGSETLAKIKIATTGDSNALKVGNGVIAIGNALGYGQSVTVGVVSALNREVTTDSYVQDMIQTDAAINGGNSGGALLNSKGEVVGINSVKYSSNYSSDSSIEGMGFAIPMSVITPMLEKLIGGEDDEGITLGIEGYMTTSGAMSGYKLPDGLYISAIAPGSNAANSDLAIGNILTHVDGSEITSIDSLKKVLNKKEKGDKIVLKVKYAERTEYKEKEIVITLN